MPVCRIRLAERGGCVVDFVEERPDSDLTADVVDRIDADTSVVAIGWVQYVSSGYKGLGGHGGGCAGVIRWRYPLASEVVGVRA